MQQYRKILVISSLVLLLVLSFTGLASADVLHGAGTLTAKGNGVAVLKMSGTVDIEGHGVGLVRIRGADVIRANGQGRRVDGPNGGVTFYGFQGEIHVVGDELVVRMIGKQIEFTAEGEGMARLHGRGTYETGKGRVGDWGPDGLDVSLEE